jgi:hypothetical protein
VPALDPQLQPGESRTLSFTVPGITGSQDLQLTIGGSLFLLSMRGGDAMP